MENPIHHTRSVCLQFRAGFSLVVTLMLMVLLSLIAVGLLSLSSISLRMSSQGQAAAVARANARLALQIAIGALQKHTGPDQRITVTADQIPENLAGEKTGADPKRRNWTGVYRSWLNTETSRPTPSFQEWLVSGAESETRDQAFATRDAADGGWIKLVGAGSVGGLPDGEVIAPMVSCSQGGGIKSRYAWWIGDQGVKAAIATSPPGDAATGDLAGTRSSLQSAPRNAAEVVASTGGVLPYVDLPAFDPRLGLLTDWQQGELLASSPAAQRPLFHDLAARSAGLLTDVRSGGFRKDLSFHLEKSRADAPRTPLYTVNGAKGINEGELWIYYNFWRELGSGSPPPYTTGGSIGAGASFLRVAPAKAEAVNDPSALWKQPSVVSYQTILSFYARPVSVGGKTVSRLAVVVDPIVTMWNPLDVPVVVTPAYNSVKYWQLPYDVTIRRPSGVTTVSLSRILGAGGWHYLTLVIGKTLPVVIKPGEVLMFSQGANTAVTPYNAGLNFINAQAGWNFGGGISLDIKSATGAYIESAADETFTYEVTPNGITSSGSQEWMLTENAIYYKEDRDARGESLNLGSLTIDWIEGKPSSRIKATDFPGFFGKVRPSDTRPLTFQQVLGRKEPFMLFSFANKTETGSDRPGRFMSRYNPKALSPDFQTLSADELETLPCEVRIEPLNNVKKFPVSINGQSYFGGGTTAQTGNSTVITHTVPREPVHSLAAFQHAFANGFTPMSSGTAYGVLASKSLVLPQISHAIGNSMATSVIPPDKTSSTLTGPRVLLDHSYLVNEALWDSWFLSSVAPQTASGFPVKREQIAVARDFFEKSRQLPNRRYRSMLGGETPAAVVAKLFSGDRPKTDAHLRIAAHLVADGMFNINSTSVEAWKSVLSGLKEQAVVTRDPQTGKEAAVPPEGIPVASLLAPENQIAKGADLDDLVSTPQWLGRRVLSDAEVTELAKAIVIEVRKRGPFLSLADFVNRRPGNDKELARCGAIQSALDSDDVTINASFNKGPRASFVGGPDRGFVFPEAEAGPSAYGIPGVVKQADLLTPIAPYLAARSDTFLIRAYGDSVDAGGKVVARAWCEAEVQREASFIDPIDPADTATTALKPVNKTFGRRYRMLSFRWLTESEV